MVAWATLDYFSVEALNLVWHLQHGFHAEVGGIRMRVPLTYEADAPNGLPELTITRISGRAWHGGGFIMINFRRPSTEAEEAALAMLPNKLVTRQKVGERALTFAGRPGMCVEYIPHAGDSLLNHYLQAMNARDIDCWFGDVGVELLGSAKLKDDLYNIIQTAQPIGRNN